MSVMKRMSEVFQEKINALLNRAEDPTESLQLAYERQLEALQQVRRNVADVLTSEKRLELQSAQLQQSLQRLEAQAREALAQRREDLARLALTRAQTARAQLDGLDQQTAQLKDQEQKLELTAQKLQAKVEAFRTQKETIKAQYSAAEASTRIGEAVTGLSEQMADVNLMVDRAQEKTAQMQARAAAIDQLVDSGVLDQVGAGGQDDIDRQLAAGRSDVAVEAQLQSLKAQLGPGATAARLPDGSEVVRLSGGDQYRVSAADRPALDELDGSLAEAVRQRDEAAFRARLAEAIALVRSRGQKLPASDVVPSGLVIPSEDTTLEEAVTMLETREAAARRPATPTPGPGA
ncbi:MAG TPA: PspA/IM30 family protein [Candidatus Dormibacteraeota bacterium]|nr:PspA/IM30 family protein [Candidatus Dormibacteraeota bacterium]